MLWVLQLARLKADLRVEGEEIEDEEARRQAAAASTATYLPTCPPACLYLLAFSPPTCGSVRGTKPTRGKGTKGKAMGHIAQMMSDALKFGWVLNSGHQDPSARARTALPQVNPLKEPQYDRPPSRPIRCRHLRVPSALCRTKFKNSLTSETLFDRTILRQARVEAGGAKEEGDRA